MSPESHYSPARPSRRSGGRLVFLLLGAFALLAGLDGALILLGLPAPVIAARLADVHGPLMVFGFVGVIGGDARGLHVLVQWGGLANIVAVLLFVGVAVVSVLVGAPAKPARPRRPNPSGTDARPMISLGARK